MVYRVYFSIPGIHFHYGSYVSLAWADSWQWSNIVNLPSLTVLKSQPLPLCSRETCTARLIAADVSHSRITRVTALMLRYGPQSQAHLYVVFLPRCPDGSWVHQSFKQLNFTLPVQVHLNYFDFDSLVYLFIVSMFYSGMLFGHGECLHCQRNWEKCISNISSGKLLGCLGSQCILEF